MGTGPLSLHGGGEALPGDEPTARLALNLARAAAAAPAVGSPRVEPTDATRTPVRVAIVPLATARGRPALTAAHIASFLESVASAEGAAISIEAAAVLDRPTADDAAIVQVLRSADLIVLPGGDPDLLPTVLPGTAAWRAILDARDRAAVIWGASAGAMALGEWCWTPGGGQVALGLVPRVAVAPHVEDGAGAADWIRRLATRPSHLGILTLAERTSVVGPLEGSNDEAERATRRWRCVGPGVAAWIAPGAATPGQRATAGQYLRLPA